jgi:hypothetical protein
MLKLRAGAGYQGTLTEGKGSNQLTALFSKKKNIFNLSLQ